MSMPVETITNQSLVAGGQLSASDDGTLTESWFYWREGDGVKALICKPLEDAGFVNGFSTRLGGVSTIKSEPPASAGGFFGNELNLAGFDEDSSENIFENRRRFLSVFDGEYELATAWQVHGDSVKVVRTEDDIRNSEELFDALVSNREKTLVGVKTADCVPILIGDPVSGSFAAIHAGWKGTASAIVVRAIDTMQSEFTANPKNMVAAIGPCASGANYEVGQDVIERFRESVEDSEKYFTPTRPGHALVDLKLANKDRLISSGLAASKIFTAPYCTMDRTDLFFSYRVERELYGKTGRLMSVIGRKCQSKSS